MDLDILQIIFAGADNHVNDFYQYLKREFKKAERDYFYTIESFCIDFKTKIDMGYMEYDNSFTCAIEYIGGYEYIVKCLSNLRNEIINPEPVTDSKMNYAGLSNFLKGKGLADITAGVLQAIHQHKALPLSVQRIKWNGLAQDAECFRLTMWPDTNRSVFNSCFIFGKNGLKPESKQNKSIYADELVSFF